METTQIPTPAPVGVHPPPGELPAEWREGVSRVQAMPPPAGFASDKWRQVQVDAARLLDEHGAALHRLGWRATDVWGVHPTVPGVALHCAGVAVVLGGARVVEVTDARARGVRAPERGAVDLRAPAVAGGGAALGIRCMTRRVIEAVAAFVAGCGRAPGA